MGVVVKAGLAAAIAWALAVALTDVPDPVLAPLAALITVRVSVRSSVSLALQRSAAVVLGVLAALLIGNAVGLNTLTVGLLTAASLGVAQLVLRLPRQAATQAPVSILVVLAAIASRHGDYGWERVLDTVIGATVGAAVSLVFPASRVTDARQTLDRLGVALGSLLDAMSEGLRSTWTSEQTAEWRRTGRVTRERLVDETREAIGNGSEAAKWNLPDRRHLAELGRYEQALPRLERAAIGVWGIARGLDDHAQLTGGEHRPMPDMAALLSALGRLVRILVDRVLGLTTGEDEERAFADVAMHRAPCEEAAVRQAHRAMEGTSPPGRAEFEWMSYAALLVQVDRIVEDLRGPTPV